MRTVAMGLVAVLALAGCTGSTTDKSAPEPSLSVSSSIAAPSPAPSLSPSLTAFESFPPAPANESKDQAAVRAAWMRYWQVLEKYTSNPLGYTDFTETQQVATGEEAISVLDLIQDMRQQKLRSTGGLKFKKVIVGKPSVSKNGRTAVVSYCIDNTSMVVLDKNDKPAAKGPSFLEEDATLIQEEDGVWRVAMVRNKEVKSC